MAILFINGVNDRSRVTISFDRNKNIRYEGDGNCNVMDYLRYPRGEVFSAILFGEDVNQPAIRLPSTPDLVFNQISDADTHHGALRRCRKLCDQIGAPVINHPDLIHETTRDKIAKRLSDIPGVRMPRTVRCHPRAPKDVFNTIASTTLGFPVLFREAGVHGGKSTILLKSPEHLSLLHRYAMDGRAFYITEYCDFKDEIGLYHKARIVVIDGEPMLRHALFSTSWAVNSKCRDAMLETEDWDAYIARQQLLQKSLEHEFASTISAIHGRLGLDYFGIDCHVRSANQLLVFEVNANMNVLHNPYPQFQGHVDAIRDRIAGMIERKAGRA